MTKPRLTYFDMPVSRGEECRLALHLAGVDFEDHRVTFADWPALKPSTPYGAMPVLELPGQLHFTTQMRCLVLAMRPSPNACNQRSLDRSGNPVAVIVELVHMSLRLAVELAEHGTHWRRVNGKFRVGFGANGKSLIKNHRNAQVLHRRRGLSVGAAQPSQLEMSLGEILPILDCLLRMRNRPRKVPLHIRRPTSVPPEDSKIDFCARITSRRQE